LEGENKNRIDRMIYFILSILFLWLLSTVRREQTSGVEKQTPDVV
jgi:hypothetical protein